MNRTDLRWPMGYLAIVLLLAGVAPATAQIDTGWIVGTVKDAQGGVIPGATVTATQVGTNTVSTATTNQKGEFAFPNLKIGVYAVAAELQGFKRGVRPDLVLHVQERLVADFTLELGALTEEVVVRGRSELLQTQTADIGYAVDSRKVTDLPLLGRRYAELAFLTPGVVVAAGGITGRGEDSFFNVNGNFATWNNFTLDGADNNSASTNLQERSPQVVQPPVDALEEFRVQTRTYSAEFGKSAGAVINASIKQGSNQFHGSGFEFFRNERFNANTWENNRAGRPRNTFNQNIFGGTFGGPIKKDRLFFFGDYQYTDTSKALSQLSTVPTPLMRQGNFSELAQSLRTSPFIPAGCLDPASKTVLASCIDPVAAKLMALYPQPNIPQAIAAYGVPNGFVSPNFINNGVLDYTIQQFDVRADQNLRNGKDRLLVRYSFQDTKRFEPPALADPVASGDFSSNNYIRGQSAVAGWSRVIGGSLFSEFRFGWNRVRSDVLHPAFGMDVASQYGITGLPADPRFAGGIPHINISGLTRLGGPFYRPQFQTSSVFQFAENLTWTKGSHTAKFGVERRRDLLHYIDLRALNGVISFSNGRYSNSGMVDFALGLAASEGLTLFHEPHLYADGWQAYAQDAWRVLGNLTINYGLRYEYFTPVRDRDGILTNIDPATGQIITASKDGSIFEQALVDADYNNLAPRAGFAWSITPKIVIRGGYGIFYQHSDRYGSESQLALNPPQLVDANLTTTSAADPPVMILKNGFVPITAANIDKSKVQWRIQDPNQKTPWVQQFSFGPELQLAANMSIGVEYVGNITKNGRKLRNINQGIITAPGQVTFPYAQYGFGTAYLEQIATYGTAKYHALQVRLQKRMSGGLSFTSSFTWSRALGNFIDHLSADGGGASGNFPLNVYDLASDWGPLAFDTPRRFVTSFIYELPWGSGRRFTAPGFGGALVSDWNVNGIITLSDGRPFSIAATDRANTGSGRTSRANCVGDPLPDGFDQTVGLWFDTTAFAEPSSYTYGNCGINTMRGPGLRSVNFSLFRSIPFSGNRRLEFRAEIFNLFNWPNFGFPGASVSNPATFGKISSTQGDPREMQFAVKFYF